MKKFPDIRRWFDIVNYNVINSCRKIEVNMKILSDAEIDEFCKEFALFICRLRCPSVKLLREMEGAVNGSSVLKSERKKIFQHIFYIGFISDKKYNLTKDFKLSFDDEAVKGYFGECFYYILREQIFEDEKVCIEPKFPKKSSKVPGIDFVDIRKDADGYYMIIGEVKTTKNNYSTRLPEIIQAFQSRMDKNFSEIYQSILESDDESIPEYSVFLEEMLDIFYRLTGSGSKKKRVAGAINYDYQGKNAGSLAFRNVKEELKEIVDDFPVCRRFKLIGIYNIEDVIERMRDRIWNVL